MTRISPRRAARLNTKKQREEHRLFLVEGPAFIREAPRPPLQLFEAQEDVRRLSTLTTPTGPVGVFPFLDEPAKDLLSGADRIIFLDGVQDPGNVGTVIRSAYAFGAAVVLSRGCADLYNPKTVRATMGSIFRVPISREAGVGEFLGEARRTGFGTVAAVPEGGEAPRKMPAGRLVIAVGSEGAGLSPEATEACRKSVSVPSRAASLNAAIAASILLYEAQTPVLP